MYTHIAHALARGYIDLYYVNMETDEFVDFHTDDRHGVLTEARQGKDFFESCVREAEKYIHPEDRESFVRAMDRKTLEKSLAENNRFELTFRRIVEEKPLYVKMTVTRMEDDKRFIVIAVSDIDELMKQRQAEEQIREVAASVQASGADFLRGGAFKPRTSPYDFQGMRAEGLELLLEAKQHTGMPVVTEIVSADHLPLFRDCL